MSNMTKTLALGNNERISRGIVEVNGMYLALTYAASKTFKTRQGAVRWLAVRGYDEDGQLLPESSR